MKLTLKAYAKVNLALDIKGKAEDGYHMLDMIMQSVSLCDVLTVTKTDRIGEISLCGNNLGDMPLDRRNTMVQAANVIYSKLYPSLDFGVKICIDKKIPSAAGLAGGSADAAAVFKAINRFAGDRFSSDELCEMSGRVGSDIAFCLHGSTVRASGRGEILKAVSPLENCTFLLSKGDTKPSTGEMYRRFDSVGSPLKPDCNAIEAALAAGDLQKIGSLLCNVFESCWQSDAIEYQKAEMLRHGACGAIMSGAGPTVFGIFDNAEKAEKCRKKLAEIYPQTYTAKPVKCGVLMI